MEEFGVSFLNKDVGTMDRKELVNYLSMYLSNALNYKEVVKAKERKKQAILAEAESTLRATEENYKKYASLELTKSQREVRPQITALMEKIEQQEPYPVKRLFGMATVFLTNFIRCRTSFRMLFRLSLTMSLLGCDDLRQELTVKVRLPR
ncbi:hypothetical protein ACFC9R_02580, partial [Enterococcus casseliflavus]